MLTRPPLGPEYAPRARDVFIDNSVMDGDRFEEREEIMRVDTSEPRA